MVDTNAYRSIVFATKVNKWHKCRFYFFYLFGIFFVGVRELLEGATGINKIAWIDAHFFHHLGSSKGRSRVEMYVGNKWCCYTTFTQLSFYIAKVFGFAHTLRSESYI